MITQTIATRLNNGQTSIKRPLEIPIYHQGEDIGRVTEKRICDCNPGIQELWIGHDHLAKMAQRAKNVQVSFKPLLGKVLSETSFQKPLQTCMAFHRKDKSDA
jgi:hypothetical protein